MCIPPPHWRPRAYGPRPISASVRVASLVDATPLQGQPLIRRLLHIKTITSSCSRCCDAKDRHPNHPLVLRCISGMPDPPRKSTVTVPISEYALDCQLQRGARPSVSAGSSQVRSLPRSPRRLPTPPFYASSSSLSSPSPKHPSRS